MQLHELCPRWNTWLLPPLVVMQAVAEMLVKNESRIKFSTAMTTFRSPRQVLLTFKLRLQVRARCPGQQLRLECNYHNEWATWRPILAASIRRTKVRRKPSSTT